MTTLNPNSVAVSFYGGQSGSGSGTGSGPAGDSAYEVALADGFVGTRTQWLDSLKGDSAYEVALAGGFVGTQADWLASLGHVDLTATDAYKFLTNDGITQFWAAVTKETVGLSNVDNTSDMDKPVSTAQQQALDLKVNTNGLDLQVLQIVDNATFDQGDL